MKHTHPFGPSALRPLAAALLSTLALSSHAVNVGIDPTTTPVVNPFTGLSTDVWKLVGRSSGCTAELITPQWILSSNHCAAAGAYYNDHLAPGATFPLMSGQTVALPQDANWPICATVTEPSPQNPAQQVATDMFICRLAGTNPIPNAGPFPPLVAGPIRGPVGGWPTLPTYAQLADRSAGFGSLMLYGHGNGGNKVGFVGFNGLPYGYSPITDPTGATIPELNGGDSGGGIYSYSTITGQWALTGITTHPLQFLTEDAIAFIKTHISQYGDTPPVSVSSASHYGDLSVRSAADLAAPPTASLSGSTLTVRWAAPADASVTSYSVSYGHDGLITGRTTIGAASALQASIPASGARYWTACVQPVNPKGPGNAAWVTNRYPGAKAFVTPGCSTFDLAVPGAVGTVTVSSARQASTGLFKISSSWTAPVNSAVTISAYRVTTSISYLTGPKRVSTTDVKTLSASTSVTAGSKVCVSVAAISAFGVVGSASPQQCALAQ
jgi:hypothetical protein